MIDRCDSCSHTSVSWWEAWGCVSCRLTTCFPTLLLRLWLQMASHKQDGSSQRLHTLSSLLIEVGSGDASSIFIYSQWFTDSIFLIYSLIVCMKDVISKQTNKPKLYRAKKDVSKCNSVAHWCVLIMFGWQHRYTAPRNKIYHALDAHKTIGSKINSLLVWLC